MHKAATTFQDAMLSGHDLLLSTRSHKGGRCSQTVVADLEAAADNTPGSLLVIQGSTQVRLINSRLLSTILCEPTVFTRDCLTAASVACQ